MLDVEGAVGGLPADRWAYNLHTGDAGDVYASGQHTASSRDRDTGDPRRAPPWIIPARSPPGITRYRCRRTGLGRLLAEVWEEAAHPVHITAVLVSKAGDQVGFLYARTSCEDQEHRCRGKRYQPGPERKPEAGADDENS